MGGFIVGWMGWGSVGWFRDFEVLLYCVFGVLQ